MLSRSAGQQATRLPKSFIMLCAVCKHALTILLCSTFQDSLEPEKVSVAIRAAGLDADGQWTKQNLAQIIWYCLLTTYQQYSHPQLLHQHQHSITMPDWKASRCSAMCQRRPSTAAAAEQPCLYTTSLLFAGFSGLFLKRYMARSSSSPSSRTLCKSSSKSHW